MEFEMAPGQLAVSVFHFSFFIFHYASMVPIPTSSATDW
jgi:hypothetical protein